MIPVAEGQAVQAGELLGASANTGQSDKPHLHFAVHVRAPDGWRRSLPIEFRSGQRGGFVPEEGSFVGMTPPGNAELRIQADGVPVGEEAPHLAQDHATLSRDHQLEIQRHPRAAAARRRGGRARPAAP